MTCMPANCANSTTKSVQEGLLSRGSSRIRAGNVLLGVGAVVGCGDGAIPFAGITKSKASKAAIKGSQRKTCLFMDANDSCSFWKSIILYKENPGDGSRVMQTIGRRCTYSCLSRRLRWSSAWPWRTTSRAFSRFPERWRKTSSAYVVESCWSWRACS